MSTSRPTLPASFEDEIRRQTGAELAGLADGAAVRLAALCGFSVEEAAARVARIVDPANREEVRAALFELGDAGVVTDAVRLETGELQISVLAKSASDVEEKKKNERELRGAIARFETSRAFGRRPVTNLVHLFARGLVRVRVAWPALNPHRYEELERQAAARAKLKEIPE